MIDTKRKMTHEDFAAIYEASKSLEEVAQKTGYKKEYAAYKAWYLRKKGIIKTKLKVKAKFDDVSFAEIVKASKTIPEIVDKTGYKKSYIAVRMCQLRKKYELPMFYGK